VTERDQNKAVK